MNLKRAKQEQIEIIRNTTPLVTAAESKPLYEPQPLCPLFQSPHNLTTLHEPDYSSLDAADVIGFDDN